MTLKKIFDWSVILFVFLIPISPFLSVRIEVLAVGISIVLSFTNPDKNKLWKRIWDIGIYFLVLILGLLYTQESQTGLSVMETNFSFIGIPIIMNSYANLGTSKLKRFFYSFTLGLLIACVLCLINAAVTYIDSENPQAFFFYELTGVIDSHPTYLAYYLICSITFCLYLLDIETTWVRPFFISILILFFFLMLLLTGGQTTFVSSLLVFSFFILRFFLEKRTESRMLILGLVAIMITSMFIYSSFDPSRLAEKFNDSWDRMVVWKSVLALEANSNIFIGEGTGDYKVVLNEYYRTHGMEDYAEINFNSHNQFLQILLSNGILGLIALVTMIVRPLYLAFRKNDAFGTLIFFPFIIYGMTEVFLGRYQGVVFFALIHQLLVIYYLSPKSTISLTNEGD